MLCKELTSNSVTLLEECFCDVRSKVAIRSSDEDERALRDCAGCEHVGELFEGCERGFQGGERSGTYVCGSEVEQEQRCGRRKRANAN